jgi:hypothetical protein
MRRHGFLRHLGVYFLANLLLFLMALASGKDESISLFFLSLIGWGIGLGIHASSALRTRGEEVETTFTRWRIERRAREIAVQELSQITPRRG